MDRFELLKTDHTVKFCQDAVYIAGNVITGIMYMAGIDQWVCIGFGVVSASVLVWGTFRMNSKYGEWGLMKLHALRSHPRYIISRRKFLRLFSPTIKNRKA